MGNPSDNPKFRTLSKQWDRILFETGFRDLEDKDGNLKQRAANAYRGASAVEREARLEFFTQVSHFVTQTKFGAPLEEFVMSKFSDGFKQVEIQKMLHKLGLPRHRCTIHRIIQRWLREWKLR